VSNHAIVSADRQTVAGVGDDLRLEMIVETSELAASYARSVVEAAWRGDRLELGVHLQRLRLSTIEAIRTYKELSAEPKLAERGP
jgi:hypothetical protein